MAQSTLEQLQQSGKSKVLSYVASTGPGLSFQIADDAVRVIDDHLRSMGVKQDEKLDPLLHSLGGVGVVPWKLVNLIREYTQDFEVLIPHQAYSAATLVALGANRIVVHPTGELGPIDSKASNEFNPTTAQGQP